MSHAGEYFGPMIRKRACAAVVLGLAAVAMGAALLWLPARSDTDRLIMYACVAMFMALGAYIVVEAVLVARRHPALQAIARRPADVVWVYPESFITPQRFRPSISTITVCTRSGEELPLPCQRGREDEALAVLAPLLPHAFIGWDYDVERRFRLDPSQLGQ